MDQHTLECHLRKKLIEWWETTKKDDDVAEYLATNSGLQLDGYVFFTPCTRGDSFFKAKKVNGDRVQGEDITIFSMGPLHTNTYPELVEKLKQNLNMCLDTHLKTKSSGDSLDDNKITW